MTDWLVRIGVVAVLFGLLWLARWLERDWLEREDEEARED